MTKFTFHYSGWDKKISVTTRIAVSQNDAKTKPKEIFGDLSTINTFPKDVYENWANSERMPIKDTLLYKRLMEGRIAYINKHAIAITIDGDGFAEPIASAQELKRQPNNMELSLIDTAKEIMRQRRINPLATDLA